MGKKNKSARPKGDARKDLIVQIVATDSTFERRADGQWIGKCIHCNSKLLVGACGTTNGTLEHIHPCALTENANDLRNLALACSGCNNAKGRHHDKHAGKGGRADDVIEKLQAKRDARWRDPDHSA